jgi:hypothetical protein
MPEILPVDLKERAFRSANGEFGWSRADALVAISVLATAGHAILGGELWWVPEGASEWTGLIPQRHGPDAVYPWETERVSGEPWSGYVERCAADSIGAVNSWPGDELQPQLGGRILYNLTWVTESEFETLGQRTV